MVRSAYDTVDSTDDAAATATAPRYRSDPCLSKNCTRLSLLVICCILVLYSVVSTVTFKSLQQSLKQTVNVKSTTSTANDSDFDYVFSMQRVEAGRTCFVHVGKTAGSLIRCILGIPTPTCQRGSTSWNSFSSERNVSVIAKHVEGSVIHMAAASKGCHRNATSFLVPTRNPVARIQSWFYFEKPTPGELRSKNKLTIKMLKMKTLLFDDCYADLEEMVMEGLRKNVSSEKIPADVHNMSCPQRAWAAITGARGFASHNRYNYEFYTAKMKSVAKSRTTKMFVLRNEHLVRDWNTVDYMFGGNGTAGYSLFGTKVNKGTTKQSLSDSALEYVCRALCTEIQYYKHMLLDAENLDSKQATMSILELKEVCPQETVEIRTCVGMPEFPSYREQNWRP
jgi:hypothetical protein